MIHDPCLPSPSPTPKILQSNPGPRTDLPPPHSNLHLRLPPLPPPPNLPPLLHPFLRLRRRPHPRPFLPTIPQNNLPTPLLLRRKLPRLLHDPQTPDSGFLKSHLPAAEWAEEFSAWDGAVGTECRGGRSR